eukprot:SAG31_NODE_84_length_27014_cov_3.743006_14_plen_81_part_00
MARQAANMLALVAASATPGASLGPPLQPGTVDQCVQGALGANPPPICRDGKERCLSQWNKTCLVRYSEMFCNVLRYSEMF